ncbi:Vps54-like protein [Ancylostoma ceylanicum]|uniref:Vps54-like protein n=1 Tax=Ancylostoma ceylanicum TaxID=53326 RepID=A0A0D6LW26_9BILA|nr:Vps54-like protein [Ancylostoma ceylanicum]
MLLNQSDYPKVIECIETSEEVLSSELSGVQCFRHLGPQLTELYGVIGRMMLEDFASLIQKEFGTKPEDGVLMTYDGELACVIMGLIQVRRFGFMSMIRTEILEALKGILRHEVKLHIVQSGLDLTDFDPTLNQLGEPVRRLKFADWLKTVDDVTREFFGFCKRVQALQDVVCECTERVRNLSNATGRMNSPFVNEDTLQVRAAVDLSSSDQDVVSGPSLAPDVFPSNDPAALMAVEIRSLPQLLKSASILAEFAHHCAQTRLCRLLIARSKLQEGAQDSTTPEQLTQMISLVKTYQHDCSSQGWHKNQPIAVSPLSKCLQKLCLEYIERFHTQRRAKMSSALAFLKILADYCECFAALPTFAADILSRVVELLKAFNSGKSAPQCRRRLSSRFAVKCKSFTTAWLSLFETVHEHFKGNLKLHLAKIGISPHDSLKYGYVSQDYAFYAQSLRAMSSCSDLYVESLNDVIYGR